ncbi:hypothetical protein PG985_001971 [Apiospora marii]|uniref:Uncharacterized protein n=1 Tax=Apiospora marii TaxID=335849 RepID=A0ABR1RY79_9PEZI
MTSQYTPMIGVQAIPNDPGRLLWHTDPVAKPERKRKLERELKKMTKILLRLSKDAGALGTLE